MHSTTNGWKSIKGCNHTQNQRDTTYLVVLASFGVLDERVVCVRLENPLRTARFDFCDCDCLYPADSVSGRFKNFI